MYLVDKAKININESKAFEDKHRGSVELIKSRLKAYLPFILPLNDIYPNAQAIDLGCGRGEWLELLSENGFIGIGIDLDKDMLQSGIDKGLSVIHADAIAYLSKLNSESQVIVSSFHMVEHIPFDSLKALVSEALRVLKPGGLLIMETPNPENISVATKSFYTDPTHINPIPPDLLSFVPEFYGYKYIKVLRLQESKELQHASHVKLMDVYAGASPDYAVVAQKEAAAEILASMQAAFNQCYGISSEDLIGRYDEQINEFSDKTNQVIARTEELANISENLANELQCVYNSKSWRLTYPMRRLGNIFRRIRHFK